MRNRREKKIKRLSRGGRFLALLFFPHKRRKKAKKEGENEGNERNFPRWAAQIIAIIIIKMFIWNRIFALASLHRRIRAKLGDLPEFF